MNRSVQDKMVEFIAAHGEDGVTSGELAEAFLCPASAPPDLCERLIRSVLADDPRALPRPDGTWVVPVEKTAIVPGTAYTVIEAAGAVIGRQRWPLEWAAVHVDAQGRTSEGGDSAIRPEPWPQGLVVPARLQRVLPDAPDLREAAAAAAKLARGSTIVAFRPGTFVSVIVKALSAGGEQAPVLSLARLGKHLITPETRSTDALAAVLGIPVREPESAVDKAKFTAEMLAAMLTSGEQHGLGEPETWLERQHPTRLGVDFSSYAFDREFLARLPATPGIYIMRDANGEAVYVGKAVNLRARVGSYFRSRIARDEKSERILEATCAVEVEETGSELAALIAEFRTIRELQPRINIQFDVHERQVLTGLPQRRLLLITPSPSPDMADAFLLHGDRAMRKVRVPRDDPDRLRPVLKTFFFEKETPGPETGTEQEELRIAWSWLERNADKVNAVDVDLTGTLEKVLEIAARYLGEGPSRDRVFHV